MSKHAAPRRRKPYLYLVLATALVASVAGGLVLLWPPGPAPTAAGDAVRSSGGSPSIEQVALQRFDRLVVYGHSMPTGGGASDDDLGYTRLTAEATGLELVNHAEGHTTASTAADAMAASPSAGPRDVVLIHTGMNDIFRRGDGAATSGREAIERLLSGTAAAHRRVVVLECQPGTWERTPPARDMQPAYEAWNAMLREVVAASPGVELLDTCAEWAPERFTDMPKYHPNDEGHALLADELVALLRTL